MIVFDLCGTLFKSNTTFDFVKYCFPLRSAVLFSLPVRMVCKLIKCVFSYDLIRRLSVASFKGMDESKVAYMANEFYDRTLEKKKNSEIIKLLNQYKGRSIIASASIEPVVKVAAHKLGVEFYVASQLEIQDGLYTGKLSKDTLGNKLDYLPCQDIELVVTDNKSDIDLVMHSKSAIILSDKRDSSFWRSRLRECDVVLHID